MARLVRCDCGEFPRGLYVLSYSKVVGNDDGSARPARLRVASFANSCTRTSRCARNIAILIASSLQVIGAGRSRRSHREKPTVGPPKLSSKIWSRQPIDDARSSTNLANYNLVKITRTRARICLMSFVISLLIPLIVLVIL